MKNSFSKNDITYIWTVETKHKSKKWRLRLNVKKDGGGVVISARFIVSGPGNLALSSQPWTRLSAKVFLSQMWGHLSNS